MELFARGEEKKNPSPPFFWYNVIMVYLDYSDMKVSESTSILALFNLEPSGLYTWNIQVAI
jgi:hypothetical protein